MAGDGFGGTRADEVVALVEFLEAHAIVYQVNGGWAVDALAGAQTRAHRDVDVFVDAERVRELDTWLIERGYEVETDWHPVRVDGPLGERRRNATRTREGVLRAPGGRPDVRPERGAFDRRGEREATSWIAR